MIIEELVEVSGIDRKSLRRILIILEFSLRKKDGSPTSFAEKFEIQSFEDLYEYLKEVKTNLKRDHEIEGFNGLTEMWKSVAPRAQYWIMETFGEENPRDALFSASVFTMRTFGIMLDNLRLLKKIIKMLDERRKEVSEFVSAQKFETEDLE
ncbi:conserved hypothetical protein [Methanocaldococcus vulcanius M7]|uniref:Uncharacterized protein n=1 Tax=Methanocaldococcus vulcanius (strain ATCC 700851 / DSM 12094 / M7) TaxID=579137 RepID=C9RFA2_METVM|nr:hypothetical protein [Methanocaldococcus vulcanius]ACX72254.1 conserved hypothetical protein [Methanocaldococcus vulcanius M7]